MSDVTDPLSVGHRTRNPYDPVSGRAVGSLATHWRPCRVGPASTFRACKDARLRIPSVPTGVPEFQLRYSLAG